MPATPVWLAPIESLLNRGIGESIEAAACARRLEGASFEIELTGLARVRASIGAGRLALATQAAGEADARVRGSLLALIERFASPTDLASDGSRGIEISGNAEVAARYRELLKLARPDFEEELSRVVGDLPAHRIALALRSSLSWLRSAGRTAGQNLAEYLTEESRDLVSRPELEEFLAAVDQVRESADRVGARLERLERRLDGSA
jgi:ubiquinone biosynthesis accessory factor UbiJ